MITSSAAFGRSAEGVWHAPGRANLIGEHTDYNDGFVLPFALPLGIDVTASRRDDEMLEIRSQQEPDARRVALDGLRPGAATGWAAYPAGTAWALREAGHPVGGASLLIDSNLPAGAGLSSSAALECSVALALCDLYGVTVPRAELARVCRRAENEFVGVPSGIMDQSASLLCTEGHALLLDCRSGLSSQIPFDPPGLDVLIIDTRAHHELVDGGYASRRAACEEAAKILGVPALRDVTDLAGALERLDDPILLKRTRHVVTDDHRVQAAVGLLRAGRAEDVGALLIASHLSLRDDFEISWPEADVTVEAAVAAGARGARMMGGGFGGSVIALVPGDRLTDVRAAVLAAYARRGWPEPGFIDARPAAGARRMS
jgi:galactokinase